MCGNHMYRLGGNFCSHIKMVDNDSAILSAILKHGEDIEQLRITKTGQQFRCGLDI